MSSGVGVISMIVKHMIRGHQSLRIRQQVITRRVSSMATNTDNLTPGQVRSVYVQHSQGNDMMTISFEYNINGRIKSFNLYRKASEPLSTSLHRLNLNLAKYSKKKKFKTDISQGDTIDADAQLAIYHEDTQINPDEVTNIDAWVDGAVMKLNGDSFVIKRNSPQITFMRLPTIIMKGFITVPYLELSNCSVYDCEFNWYRKISSRKYQDLSNDSTFSKRISFDDRDTSYWLHLAAGITYSPTADDVAHHLKVVCQPISGGKRGLVYTCTSLRQVELGPPTCPFEKRHAHTSERLPVGELIRFVSYNVLADIYADQEYSRNFLFAHCPAHALDMDYRRQLLLKEIHGYNADIVCLQEVDKKEFVKTFEPYFKLVSQHSGIYNTKGGQVPEGVATFFRDDRFELIETHATVLSKLINPSAEIQTADEADEALPTMAIETDKCLTETSDVKTDDHPILRNLNSSEAESLIAQMERIRVRIQANPALLKRFMNRHTVLQTSLLKFKDKLNTYVIVANTHLYFAPDSDHIRLLQGCLSVKYIEFMKKHYRRMLESDGVVSPHIGIIFCGDMNSSPDCGLFKLVHDGHVGEEMPDWKSNEDEAVIGLSFDTSLRFSSSYQNIPYTNYTPGFNGCLDYIYYEIESLDCESTVPLPDHEDVIAMGGIPSDVFPSDHIALIANLRFKDR